MKGNKKILIAALLLLLISVSFGTYAIYRSTASGTGTLKAAAWSVKVNNTSIETASFTFGINDVTWTTHTGKNNTIAPGDSGTIKIPVDATGSEVDVQFSATATPTGLPSGFTVSGVSLETNQATGYIPYGASMTDNLVITVTWTGTTADTAEKDGTDKQAAGTTISIPVTVSAQQKLAA